MKYSENEIGKVINLDGDFALLEMKESESCSHCHAKIICSAGKNETRTMRIKNSLNAKIGDSVAFDTSENQQVIITMMQYGLPLVGFLLGLAGYFFIFAEKIKFPKELGAFIFGLVLMFGFGLITRFWSEKKSKSIILHSMQEIISEHE